MLTKINKYFVVDKLYFGLKQVVQGTITSPHSRLDFGSFCTEVSRNDHFSIVRFHDNSCNFFQNLVKKYTEINAKLPLLITIFS